jgi:hypothetical protein
MNANELADELVWIAKNRGDSVSRQLADIVRQQQAEIEALKKEKWLTEIDCKQQALKQIIDMLTIHHDTLACSSYPMSKENRVKKLQEEYADVFKNHWSEQP